MKKLITFILFILVSAGTAFAETVSLSTYYPAPFGAYDRVRLVPRTPAPGCTPALEGLIYYDSVLQLLQVCTGIGGFQNLDAVWEQNNIDAANAEVYLKDQVRAINVGLGTITPNDRLDLGDSAGDIRLYDGNGTPHILGDEVGGEVDGIVLRTTADPAAGQPIFVVESSASSQRLRVEHNGYVQTSNDLAVDGVGNSYIMGNVGIGMNAPTTALDVVGDTTTTGNVDLATGGANTVSAGDDTDLGIVPPQKLNIRGGINLRDNGANWGPLMVEYDAGTQSYYAVYAP